MICDSFTEPSVWWFSVPLKSETVKFSESDWTRPPSKYWEKIEPIGLRQITIKLNTRHQEPYNFSLLGNRNRLRWNVLGLQRLGGSIPFYVYRVFEGCEDEGGREGEMEGERRRGVFCVITKHRDGKEKRLLCPCWPGIRSCPGLLSCVSPTNK